MAARITKGWGKAIEPSHSGDVRFDLYHAFTPVQAKRGFMTALCGFECYQSYLLDPLVLRSKVPGYERLCPNCAAALARPQH